ncbi:T-cell-specific surface glycoprotein CD28 [Dasypus novemcinctus]|uniref:T-cell-specific surface glycoprotein CD28 n=1 Tax=Dasypus novemcinctus TaxID=9361 RepID=UPI00062A7941|nr:T-cell-specific surface glycoprotein CD28 [Dasypus novemcinctus]
MIFRLLLALNFFPSIEATENKILVKQSPMLVTYNNDVNLSCKYTNNLFSKEFRASLYKGVDSAMEVCVVNGNYSHQLQFHSKTGFECNGKLDNETVTFYLRNLNANQTDIYFCKIEIMYPPPYIGNEKSNGTIIHIKEKCLCPTYPPPVSTIPFWLLALLGLLGLYSLLATVCLFIYWMKNRRSRILQSDYMNMTPRRPGPTRKHYHQPYAPARDFAAYRS